MSSVDLPEGFRLFRKERVGSTNDEIRVLAEGGASDGTIVSAKIQTAGRGRSGRSWVSEAGNLYFSMLVRTERPVHVIPQLSFVASLAVAEAVSEHLGKDAEVQCKWPNDVLADSRKIAGILLETAPISGQMTDWLVIGVGINVASHPDGVQFPATSMHEWGQSSVHPEDVLASYCIRFSHWRITWEKEGFEKIRAAWLARAAGLGRQVEVRLGNQTLSGIFEDLCMDGTMVLLGEDGRKTNVSCGDVFPVNEFSRRR